MTLPEKEKDYIQVNRLLNIKQSLYVFLLQKKELRQHHPETQLLEDVICLVFIEHYLEDFAQKHDDEKVIEILKKTMQKMSPRAIAEAGKIPVSPRINALLARAAA